MTPGSWFENGENICAVKIYNYLRLLSNLQGDELRKR